VLRLQDIVRMGLAAFMRFVDSKTIKPHGRVPTVPG
jgi:hypothetical protein